MTLGMKVPQLLQVSVPVFDHSHWEIFTACYPVNVPLLATMLLSQVSVAVGQAGLCHTTGQDCLGVTCPPAQSHSSGLHMPGSGHQR